MKNTKLVLVFLLVFALVFPTASAWASEEEGGGLGGLTGGGLSGLLSEEEQPTGDPGVVVDPAELLGTAGRVLQEEYQFSSNYVCTAYVYGMPADLDGFITAYTQQMADNGFAAEQTLVDGADGWSYTWTDGTYALLVPDFEGSVLLLVQDGMTFGEPLPDGYYIRFERNGRSLEGTWSSGEASCEETRRLTGTSHSFSITYYFSRAEITYFSLEFPSYALAGDEFYVTRHNLIDGVTFYTNEESFLVNHDLSRAHQMESDEDHLRIKVNAMYEADGGTVIEGEFDGSFNRGETIYSDGSFRVLLFD